MRLKECWCNVDQICKSAANIKWWARRKAPEITGAKFAVHVSELPAVCCARISVNCSVANWVYVAHKSFVQISTNSFQQQRTTGIFLLKSRPHLIQQHAFKTGMCSSHRIWSRLRGLEYCFGFRWIFNKKLNIVLHIALSSTSTTANLSNLVMWASYLDQSRRGTMDEKSYGKRGTRLVSLISYVWPNHTV